MKKKRNYANITLNFTKTTTKKEKKYTPRPLFGDKLREHEKLAQIGGKQTIALAEY